MQNRAEEQITDVAVLQIQETVKLASWREVLRRTKRASNVVEICFFILFFAEAALAFDAESGWDLSCFSFRSFDLPVHEQVL